MEQNESIDFFREPWLAFSPIVTSSNFYHFGYVKNQLEGQRLRDTYELLDAIVEINEQIPRKNISSFMKWII